MIKVVSRPHSNVRYIRMVEIIQKLERIRLFKNFAIPHDTRVYSREVEKVEMYQDLA